MRSQGFGSHAARHLQNPGQLAAAVPEFGSRVMFHALDVKVRLSLSPSMEYPNPSRSGTLFPRSILSSTSLKLFACTVYTTLAFSFHLLPCCYRSQSTYRSAQRYYDCYTGNELCSAAGYSDDAKKNTLPAGNGILNDCSPGCPPLGGFRCPSGRILPCQVRLAPMT